MELGGDADSTAAILGAWLGALHGAAALPQRLVERLQQGPCGRDHLGAIAAALIGGGSPPRASPTVARFRNLLLFPVVLLHDFRRLTPW